MVLIALGFTKRARKKAFKNREITCIYFHNPNKALFGKCVNWLIKKGYTILTSDELIDIYEKKSTPPEGAAWISFDDGWKNNMTDALPVLVEKKVPATFFISTGPVETSGVFWWSLAEENKEMLPQKFRDDFDLLWKVPEKERAETISLLESNFKKTPEREAMTVDDIRSMANYDFITIGSHTVNHVITVNCSDKELEDELTESKYKLEEWTGREINIFSFPNGDYNGRDIDMLMRSGYKSSVIVENRAATANDNIYKIPRFSVGNASFAEELCHMLGVWQKVISKIK